MEILVSADGWLLWGGRRLRCALGRGGVRIDKREGDGATPAGGFPLRRLFYRSDRLPAPRTRLASRPLKAGDGWCDDPAHAAYNSLVPLPFAGRCEALWRDDGLYDVIVVLGHNDAPPVPGRGSAIFLHVATADYAPTQGCVALAKADLVALVADCGGDTVLRVTPD